MDFSKVISEKREELRQLGEIDSFDEVLRHLEAAEKHFNNARQQGDSELFTDVIYRSNQVFEGILKEAYQVIAKNDGSKKTPSQIEDYFTKNTVFRPRVLEYFSRYRKEWRNPSTHDHRLDFDEQEAFLAYSTVCGFCFVALNQMIQILASEKTLVDQSDSDIQISAQRIAEILVAGLPSLLRSLQIGASTLKGHVRISEAALLGGIEGLIRSASKTINIVTEAWFTSVDSRVQADLSVSQLDKHVIVDLKRLSGRGYQMIEEQIAKNAVVAKAIGGVGVIVPGVYSATAEIAFEAKAVEGTAVPIYLVLPKSR